MNPNHNPPNIHYRHGIHENHPHAKLDEQLFRILRENLTREESLLSEVGKSRLEHLRLHEKHRGHEEMHAEMILILFSATAIAQCCLLIWRKKHYKSYQFVSMLGVWIIPFIFCLNAHFWIFTFIWLLLTCITLFVLKKAMERPLSPTTPKAGV